MLEEILIAGFGGQGILSAGELLARAATAVGLNACFSSLYGPRQRGGTANCAVVISTDLIDVPIPDNPSIAVVMNQPSLDKFAEHVQAGGLLLFNTSLTTAQPERRDIRCVGLPATETAAELGDSRAANMVMVGALAALSELVPLDTLEQNLHAVFGGSNAEGLELDCHALRAGVTMMQQEPVA